jgi:hypothetical protein
MQAIDEQFITPIAERGGGEPREKTTPSGRPDCARNNNTSHQSKGMTGLSTSRGGASAVEYVLLLAPSPRGVVGTKNALIYRGGHGGWGEDTPRLSPGFWWRSGERIAAFLRLVQYTLPYPLLMHIQNHSMCGVHMEYSTGAHELYTKIRVPWTGQV